jgi:hypothetical protein
MAFAIPKIGFSSEDRARENFPELIAYRRIARMQHPTDLHAERLLAYGLIDDCKRGDLLHTTTTLTVTVSPARQVDTLQKAELFGAHARVVYTQPAHHKDVTEYLIAAPAFAAWLAALPEAPSAHIAAWFEAAGVNTQPEAPPVPTPQPIANTATPARNKRRDDFWSLIEDAQKDASDPFDTAKIWLRLCEWAQAKEKKFPLMGMAGDNIQWLIDKMDEPKEFTRKMLSDRLGKQKRTQQRKPKPPLKRVK